jgi:hypothetical protein
MWRRCRARSRASPWPHRSQLLACRAIISAPEPVHLCCNLPRGIVRRTVRAAEQQQKLARAGALWPDPVRAVVGCLQDLQHSPRRVICRSESRAAYTGQPAARIQPSKAHHSTLVDAGPLHSQACTRSFCTTMLSFQSATQEPSNVAESRGVAAGRPLEQHPDCNIITGATHAPNNPKFERYEPSECVRKARAS